MAARGIVLGSVLLGVLSGCQWLDSPRDDAEKRALRRRVEDLEAQLRLCSRPTTAASRPAATAPEATSAAGTGAAPAVADAATPLGPAVSGLATPPPQEPPAGMLPPPRPPAPPRTWRSRSRS